MCEYPSGSAHQIVPRCPQGQQCPLHEALERRGAFLRAITALNTVSEEHRTDMQMARFVKDVAEQAANAQNISASDVWGNMLGTGRQGSATSYADSYLKEHLEGMERAVREAREEVEQAAEQLVEILEQSSFQEHLVQYHKEVSLSADDAEAYYDVSPDDAAAPVLREIDHYLALLTDQLHLTEAGTRHLEALLSDQALDRLPGFKDVWGYFGQARAVSEPLGKFFYNVAPIITNKMTELLHRSAVRSIEQVFGHADVRGYIDFLNAKFGVDVGTWMQQRAQVFGNRADEALEAINDRRDLRRAIRQWNDLPEGQLHGDLQKLDGAWMNLTLGIVSFAAAAVKIAQDWQRAGLKDWAGTIADLASLAQTLGQTFETNYRVNATVMRTADAGDEAVGRLMMRANAARGFAVGIGVLAHVMTMVVSVVALTEGIESRDWDAIALGSAGLVVSFVGFFAGLAGAAVVAGVCTVIGVVLVVLTAIILDPPIVDYLEDTHWGEDHVTPISGTIDAYYKKMFSLRVRFILNDFDANNSHIEIESYALSDNVPVYVTIKQGSMNLGREAVYPGRRDVDGNGRIEKNVQWHTTRPFSERAILLYEPWDIWTDIRRDASTEYKIEVGMDPDRDQRMELQADTDDVTFPRVQPPILIEHLPPPLSRFRNRTQIPRGPQHGVYIAYPSNGYIEMNIHTRYATRCRARIVAERDGFFSNDHLSTVTADISDGATRRGDLLETPVRIPVPEPESDDEYTLILRCSLLDRHGRAVEDQDYVSEIQIATQSYIDRQRR